MNNYYINSIIIIYRNLFVRIDIDLALDAVLTNVCPAVARFPLSLALRALELSETALLSLVRRQAFFAWRCL